MASRYNTVAGKENIQTYWLSITAALEHLGTSPRSSLILSQRVGKVYVESAEKDKVGMESKKL